MKLTYTIRRSDLAWMLLSTRAIRLSVFAGLAFLAFSYLASPGGRDHLVGDVVISCASIVLFPLVGSRVLLRTMSASRMPGTAVELDIDAQGVRGWPFWPELDRTWSDLRGFGHVGGAITLPFDDYLYGRKGWVIIPTRALSPQQRTNLVALAALRHAAR